MHIEMWPEMCWIGVLRRGWLGSMASLGEEVETRVRTRSGRPEESVANISSRCLQYKVGVRPWDDIDSKVSER